MSWRYPARGLDIGGWKVTDGSWSASYGAAAGIVGGDRDVASVERACVL